MTAKFELICVRLRDDGASNGQADSDIAGLLMDGWEPWGIAVISIWFRRSVPSDAPVSSHVDPPEFIKPGSLVHWNVWPSKGPAKVIAVDGDMAWIKFWDPDKKKTLRYEVRLVSLRMTQ